MSAGPSDTSPGAAACRDRRFGTHRLSIERAGVAGYAPGRKLRKATDRLRGSGGGGRGGFERHRDRLDINHELRRAKLALGVGVLFIVSLVGSCTELRYALFSTTVDAQVTMAKPTLQGGRRGRSSSVLLVEYQFTDNGTVRKEQDIVDPDWPAQAGATTPVQYISGTDVSRLAGHSNMLFVYLFGASLVGLAVVGFRFWRFYKS